MIKKLLTMSAGIVLGCTITTASFAQPSLSNDCWNAKGIHQEFRDWIQRCKEIECDKDELAMASFCRRAWRDVVRYLCPLGEFGKFGINLQGLEWSEKKWNKFYTCVPQPAPWTSSLPDFPELPLESAQKKGEIDYTK
jgi:hypothetical protein